MTARHAFTDRIEAARATKVTATETVTVADLNVGDVITELGTVTFPFPFTLTTVTKMTSRESAILRAAHGWFTVAPVAFGDHVVRAVYERITIEDGELNCLCGNHSAAEGFQMSDANGVDIDTDDDDAVGDWDGAHYHCGRCGRVIDQDTARVIFYTRCTHGQSAYDGCEDCNIEPMGE